MTTSIADLGSILGVWAHPDDEAYLSAGLMAGATDQGQRVATVTATRGETGTSDPDAWPPHRLADERARELHDALATVGVRDHEFLGYPDGACAAAPRADAVARVAEAVRRFEPDTVVTFGPDGMTGHPDHRAVSEWVTGAWHAGGRSFRLLHATTTPAFTRRFAALHDRLGLFPPGLPVTTPEPELAVHLRLSGRALDRKLTALRAHRSQTAAVEAAAGRATYRTWWATEAFREPA